MAQLFVPLAGGFKQVTGSGFTITGESLDRPQWRGAEIGRLDTFPDVWGAVSEAEFHDWIIGVRHPLYKEGGPAWCRFVDPDSDVRREALEIAATAAQGAHKLGGRYILFPFPWPESAVYEAMRAAFARLSVIQETERIKVALNIDGQNPNFLDGEYCTRLFEEYPELSLCVDTGQLGLLARTHGKDPLELMRPWLPWTRYLHLHTSRWGQCGDFQSHLPTNASHTAERWPEVTPAAEMARLVVEAQPRAVIVLVHNPGLVSGEELEAAHTWVSDLVGAGV